LSKIKRKKTEKIDDPSYFFLKEVGHGCSWGNIPIVLWHGIEYQEFSLQVFVQSKYRGDVSATITIVGGGPHGDQLLVKHVFVALLDELMGSTNEFEFIDSIKLSSRFRTEYPTGATRTDLPSLNIFGIRPHQITKSSFVGNFLVPLDGSDLIEGPDVGRKPAVNTKNSSIDDRGNG